MHSRSIVFPPIDPADLETRPIERARTIPADWYVDPRFHHLDREHVLARSWQLVGHTSQLPEPGSLFCLTAAGEPILVVRGDDGKVRGFFNVCRHRGGPLALRDERVSVLRCHYHGWTYGLDGHLRGVPDMAGTEEFAREDFGLVPVDLVEWEGLVFVRLDGASVGAVASPLHRSPMASLVDQPHPMLDRSPHEAFADIPPRIAPMKLSASSRVTMPAWWAERCRAWRHSV